MRLVLVFGESVLLVLCFMGAVGVRFSGAFGYDLLVPKALLGAVVVQLCLYYGDLYEASRLRRLLDLFLRLGQCFAAATAFLTFLYFAVPALKAGRGILVLWLPLAFLASLAWRVSFRWMWGREALSENVLILGTGPSAQQIGREVLRQAPLGFNVVGFLGDHAAEVGRRLVNPSVIGVMSDVPEIVQRHNVSLILVALDDRRGRMPVACLLRCRMAGVRVEEATNFFEQLSGQIMVKNLRPSWLVFSEGFRKPRLLRNSKRAVEFCAALALLVLLAPLSLLIALLIRLEGPGSVFYRQERVGEGGRTFQLVKFRTMRANAEAITGPVWASAESDPRLTRVGRHLRRLRLDELPQIHNVLRGEMSFVGPRPERPHFVEQLRKVIPYYDERHGVKPGITGWAQVRFRYGSTIEDAQTKLQYDLYYVKHMSLLLDLGIVLDTLKVMVTSRGAR
jgi:sugar transferase (PEP-CTERM system associated)